MLVYVEGGKPENLEKNPRSKARTKLRTNLTHIWYRAGIEPGPHWWEVSALTIAPTLLSSERGRGDEKHEEECMRVNE